MNAREGRAYAGGVNSTVARIATWVLAGVIGFVYGVAGVIGQAAAWGPVPIGLVVALVGLIALLVAVRTLTGERGSTLGAGVGALVATVILSGQGPGGSVVVPAPAEGEITTGVIWTFAVPLIAALIVAWPAAPARRTTN